MVSRSWHFAIGTSGQARQVKMVDVTEGQLVGSEVNWVHVAIFAIFMLPAVALLLWCLICPPIGRMVARCLSVVLIGGGVGSLVWGICAAALGDSVRSPLFFPDLVAAPSDAIGLGSGLLIAGVTTAGFVIFATTPRRMGIRLGRSFRIGHDVGDCFKNMERTNGLRHVIVHARFKTAFAISFHGVRRHGDNGHVATGIFLRRYVSSRLPRCHPSRAFQRPSRPRRIRGWSQP